MPTETQGEHTFDIDILISGENIDSYTAGEDLVAGEPVGVSGDYTVSGSAAGEGDFTGARAHLVDLITERGLAGGDIIDQLHRSVWEFDLDDAAAVHLMDRLGEADYRISEGANEQVQLEALLASVALAANED